MKQKNPWGWTVPYTKTVEAATSGLKASQEAAEKDPDGPVPLKGEDKPKKPRKKKVTGE